MRSPGHECLSIIVPVYNEARTVRRVIDRVLTIDLPIPREVLIVDDGSTDETRHILDQMEAEVPGVIVIRSPRNRGKGAAVRLGLARATGSVVAIQDADLELDPQDLSRLVEPILRGESAVVFGSRFLQPPAGVPRMTAWANRVLTMVTNVLFGASLTDQETCYKVMRIEVARGLSLTANRFDIEPQIAARLLRAGHHIVERPVSYAPRSRVAGKKIGWRDGVQALQVLVSERLRPAVAAAPADRRFVTAALVVLVAHLALGYAHESGLRPDDDRLYLHYLGAQMGRAAESADAHARVADALRAAGASENTQWRFHTRQDYAGNYLVPTLIYRAAGDATRAALGRDPLHDYPAYLARAMFWGYSATWVLMAASLVLLAWSLRDTGWLVSLAAAVGGIAGLHSLFHVLSLFGMAVGGGLLLLPDVSSGAAAWDVSWRNLVGMLLNPGPPSTIFGDTPRHHFNLLALGVFVLRWRGRLGASYAWLLCLSLVHQSHVGLLATVLLATDGILRPRALRSWAGGIGAAAVLLWGTRETMGGLIGVGETGGLPLLAVAAGAAAVVVIVAKAGAAAPVREWIARLRSSLLSLGPVGADLTVLGVLWAGSFVAAAALNAYASPVQSLNFWRPLHGRLLAMLRPALVLACAHGVITAIGRAERLRGPRGAWVIALVVTALALIPGAAFVARQPRQPVAALEQGLRRIEAAAPPEIDWSTIGRAREAQIYYSLLREMERRR